MPLRRWATFDLQAYYKLHLPDPLGVEKSSHP